MKDFKLAVVLAIAHFFVQAQTFVPSSFTNTAAPTSETYRSFTFNGAWCWFSDPRAVYFERKHKRTYAGWIDNFGDIHVGFYDHETKAIQTVTLYDNLEIDDHDNPSLLFDEEGKLIVFFNTHLLSAKPLYQIKAIEPESIKSWGTVKELHLNDPALKDLGQMNACYSNPVKLSAERGRIYLFWRGIDGKPSCSFSDDNGENWSVGKIIFMPERKYGFRRPYTKIFSDGKSKIHFTFTDGHPRREAANSIYYMYYEGGAFYKADGSKIKDLGSGPVTPKEADLVYDGKLGKARGWTWDIGEDGAGNPVIAYAKYPDEQTHIYCYSTWQNGKWNNFDLINSGRWFPETMEGIEEIEPHYSGGISIDHETPHTLYLSVNRDSVFEIEKWVSSNAGGSWQVTKLTNGSTKNNVRPFAIRGAQAGNPLQVLWMQNTKYHHYAFESYLTNNGKNFEDRLHASIKMNTKSPTINAPLEKQQIINIMRQTADWQLANPFYSSSKLDWPYGALYTGVRALYEVTGERRYLDEMINIGQSNQWQPMNEVFHADRLTIIDNWAWLYGKFQEPEMIDKSQWVLDMHLARNYKKGTNVKLDGNPTYDEWWTWCDALFMAPPSFVQMWKVTGEEKYLDYVNEQWWKTSDYLYSNADSLYFRDDRFFEKISDNGKKVFWGRGNGWVIAGLARMLENMPKEFAGRAKFERQYKEMAHKLLSIQDEDGLWRVSLLDPEYLDTGESSGSAFFTFALAWGLNNGMIGQEYRPQVEKAWTALCKNVTPEGKLGYVQQIAGDPYPFTEDQWHVYATGAFLLAGKQMYLGLGKK